MNTPALSEALKNSDLVVDRATIDAAVARLGATIARDYSIGAAPVYITVLHGALPFAGQLALEVGAHGTDLQFDYAHATRYRGTAGGELVWKHRPTTALYGRRVLLVDDILDEGYTLAAVKQWCLEQGATDVRIVVLAEKKHGRLIEGIAADYVGLEVPDRYVFGFGMDYNEQGRNLPGIYALKD